MGEGGVCAVASVAQSGDAGVARRTRTVLSARICMLASPTDMAAPERASEQVTLSRPYCSTMALQSALSCALSESSSAAVADASCRGV